VRVAALYDVHGNVAALEAVLRDVARENVDLVLFGGDLAWGPFPRETLDLARTVAHAEFIRGNADEISKLDTTEARRVFVSARLGDDDCAWLESLPFSWSGDDTLYVHASPRDTETPYFAWSAPDVLAAALDGVTESRVVSGHVHMQSNVRVRDKEWTCAGSVGYPYEDSPGAYWTLLVDGTPEFRRTEYDLDATAAAIRGSGHPRADEYADMLLRPMTPEEVRTTWGSA
jgi:predicted phosphodiesterase